jgi:hypothetical protein
MKTFLTLLCIFTVSIVSIGQVAEGTAAYNKVEHTAIVGKFDFAPDLVKDAIIEDMKYRGFVKSSESKGYRLFAGILFKDLSQETIDLYLKIDPVKKEKDKSVVYVLISKGGENFVTSSTDQACLNAVIDYLQALKPKFEARQLEINIEQQEALIKKTERSYNSLIGTGENLQSKKKDIEENIAKNLKEQENQKAILEKEKELLEKLKSQRK